MTVTGWHSGASKKGTPGCWLGAFGGRRLCCNCLGSCHGGAAFSSPGGLLQHGRRLLHHLRRRLLMQLLGSGCGWL